MDFSDMELTLPVAPEGESFYRFLVEGELAVDETILVEFTNIDDSASLDTNTSYSEGEWAKTWDGAAIDAVLAKVPEEFWKNLDRALVAPRGKPAHPQSINTLNEQLHSTSGTKEILCRQAWRLAQKGNPDAGLQCAAKLWLLGKSLLNSEAYPVYSLTALSFHCTGSLTIVGILSQYSGSEDCLRELSLVARNNRLTDEELRNALRGYFHETHLLLKEMSPSMQTDYVWELWRPADFWKKPELEPYIKKVIPWSWFYNEQATLQICADQTRLALKSAGLSLAETSVLTDESKESFALEQRIDGRFWGDLANITGRRFLYYLGSVSVTKAYPRLWLIVPTHQSLAEALIAVRRYELREGKLPESLEMLVPEYLDAVPMDYVDHQPIRYSAEKRMLWSIGTDLDNPITDPLAAWEEQDERCEFIVRLPNLKTPPAAKETSTELAR